MSKVLKTRPSWREADDFEYASEEFTANPDRCRKCHSAIWTVIARNGFRFRLDPEILTPAQKLESYVSRNRIFITWRTKAGFEVETATGIHLMADDGSRPMLGVHKCHPDNIRTVIIDPYTLTQVTIAITQSITSEMELPF
jgi:hypothetical protein